MRSLLYRVLVYATSLALILIIAQCYAVRWDAQLVSHMLVVQLVSQYVTLCNGLCNLSRIDSDHCTVCLMVCVTGLALILIIAQYVTLCNGSRNLSGIDSDRCAVCYCAMVCTTCLTLILIIAQHVILLLFPSNTVGIQRSGERP